MLKTDIEIKDAVTPVLRALHGSLAPGQRRPLMARLGKVVEVALKEHFRKRNLSSQSDSKRAKKGFPQSGVWNRIRRSTALSRVSENEAVISIGEPAFRSKLFGADIRPGPGKKSLTIPLIAAAYGKSARGNPVPGLFPLRLKGRAFLGTTEMPGSEGELTLVYLLVRAVRVPKDARALPPAREITGKLEETAAKHVLKALASKGGAK